MSTEKLGAECLDIGDGALMRRQHRRAMGRRVANLVTSGCCAPPFPGGSPGAVLQPAGPERHTPADDGGRPWPPQRGRLRSPLAVSWNT